MTLSLVVPVYNEVENLPLLYNAVNAALANSTQSWELILVNDGSRDGSTQVLERLAASDSRVRVIEFRRNYGQTAAMQAGIQAASGDVTVLLDADLQNDPNDIPKMLEKLDEGYDLVHGWRRNRQDRLLDRKLPSMMANWLISRTTGFPVHDLGCTLKVMRTEIAQELQLYGEMHRFIPILAHWRGARCVEVVTQHHPRQFGTSKYGISRTLRVLLDLMTVKYLTHYAISPMKLFGMIGLASLGLAGVSGAATIAMKIGTATDMTGNPLLLLSCFAAIMGVQFLFMGMLGELCSRIYFQVRQIPSYAVRRTINFDDADAVETLRLPAGRRKAA